MPTKKKVRLVKDLTEKLKQAPSWVLFDYSGLSVPQQQELRKTVKKAGGQFKVVKNTLLKLALEKAKLPASLDQLQGPTAALFSLKDEIAAIKALVGFLKEAELLQIKAGFFAGQPIFEDKVLELAEIPGHQELLGKTAFALNWPSIRLAQVLSGKMRKLTEIIKAVEKERG